MNLNEFIANFAEQFEDTDASEINASTVFHDLDEWDSLIALAVLNMIDKKYGKKKTFTELKACVTVEDVFNVVKNK